MNKRIFFLNLTLVCFFSLSANEAKAGGSFNGSYYNSDSFNGGSFNGSYINGGSFNGNPTDGGAWKEMPMDGGGVNGWPSLYSLGSVSMNGSTLTAPCSESADPLTTIFARAGFPFDGNGRYDFPYGTIAEAIERLESDPIVQTVCLTGTFSEAINLDSGITQDELLFYGFDGGATLDSRDDSYAISASGFSTSFTRLGFSNLRILGSGYAAVSLSRVDQLTLAWLEVDTLRYSYGLVLSENERVELAGVELIGDSDTYAMISLRGNEDVELREVAVQAEGASYGLSSDNDRSVVATDLLIEDTDSSGLSTYWVDSLELNDVLISNPGVNGISAVADTIDIEGARVEGYTRTGIGAEGETVLIQRSVLEGDGANEGLLLKSSDYALLSNNFVFDHSIAGMDVGESSGAVNVFNNSFFDNYRALNNDSMNTHYLSVTSYNNIFYSNEEQCAYARCHLSGNPHPGMMLAEPLDLGEAEDPCMTHHCAPDTLNRSLRLTSDYNLYYGCVISRIAGPADFSEWQSSYDYGDNSLSGDPLFYSTTDLHIQDGSPAINAGTDLGSYLARDIDGEERSWKFDIGADERPMSLVFEAKAFR